MQPSQGSGRKERSKKYMQIAGAKEKLSSIVEQGKEKFETALENIQREFDQRRDIVVKPEALKYAAGSLGIQMQVRGEGYYVPTHYSEGELYTRLHVPRQYINTLQEAKLYDLTALNLGRLTRQFADDGLLLRTVFDTAKGILSPSYKRIDAAPIMTAYIETAVKYGLVPYKAYNTDYRYHIEMIYPQVFEPISGEFMVYGTSLTTSDYGASALKLELMALRVVCTNLAVGSDVFKRVHIGSRFESDREIVELSRETIELDNATIASAMKDTARMLPAYFEKLSGNIKAANNQELTTEQAMDLIKKYLTKEQLNSARTYFNTPADVEVLPPTKSKWRLSNVLSLMAQSAESDDQRLDLQSLAMGVIA